MGSAERRERERQEVRTTILDGARAIMSERGFDGLTMRAVADRIESSAAAIYKHFTDREHLVRELCAHGFYEFNQMLLARPGATTFDPHDPYAALRAIGRGYAEFAINYP
jgi:AcrR family transcriptional regulator